MPLTPPATSADSTVTYQGRVAPVAIVLVLLLVQWLGDVAGDWLRYDRQAILAGEVWRVLTGHLVHLGWAHMLMNTAALALLWALAGPTHTRVEWAALTIGCALAVSLGLLLWHPQLTWYVGLSGVLHGLLVASALAGPRNRREASLTILLLITAKLAWEQMRGPLPGSADAIGGAVVVDAHLYGAGAGLAAGSVVRLMRRRRSSRVARPR